MKLNQLRDNPGAHKKPRRKGRGASSGNGKTAGRGHKGQKSRSGVSISGFEGGQMPLHRRLPKRGFKTRPKVRVECVNLQDIQRAVETNRLESSSYITETSLFDAGLVKKKGAFVKILGKGDISQPIVVESTFASRGAIKKVEQHDGQVYTTGIRKKRISLRQVGEKKMDIVSWINDSEKNPKDDKGTSAIVPFSMACLLSDTESQIPNEELDKFVVQINSATVDIEKKRFTVSDFFEQGRSGRINLDLVPKTTGKHRLWVSLVYDSYLIDDEVHSFSV